MDIDKLIKELEALKEKGATRVEVKGTLYCPSEGNYVIITTEKQF